MLLFSMPILNKSLPYCIYLFFVSHLLYAQPTTDFYRDFLLKVENKSLAAAKAHLLEKDIYLSADIDTINKNSAGQLGVVMYHTSEKTTMAVFRKQATWQLVYQEDSIPLYPYHTNFVVFKDFNHDKTVDIFVKGSDGGNREEQNNLYVAQQQSFVRVKGIENLGYWEGDLIAKGKLYYYTRYYCGCSGGCWTSQLFQIIGSQLIFKAEVGCNCEKMQYYTYQNNKPILVATDKDCKENEAKFSMGLGIYWANYLK
jgi:hypothetical protein